MNQIFFSESFGDKQLFSFVSVILVEMNENGEVSLRYSQKLAVGVTLLIYNLLYLTEFSIH